MKNSKFTVAIHALSVIALLEEVFEGDLVKSHQIADSVNTSPVVIRRTLGKLRRAGLIEVAGGATGGARLARDPHQITFHDVFLAIEDDELFSMHPSEPSQTCPVGSTITPVLQGVYDEVDHAIGATLQDKTIGHVYLEMKNAFCQQHGISPPEMRARAKIRFGG